MIQTRLRGPRRLRAALAAWTAVALGLAALPAAGQSTVYYPSAATVQVQVLASVGGRCGFASGGAPSGSVNQPDFDENGFSYDFDIVLNCNGPSRVAVVSANGGLKNAAAAPGGYTNKAPYDVALHLVGNRGTTTADASCAAATLTSGSTCSFLGPASSSKGLRLAASSTNQTGSYLRVSAPAYAGASELVAGTYADTLTVTLSASP